MFLNKDRIGLKDNMTKWAIVLFCNKPYINKTIQTIQEIRTKGEWTEDVILMIQKKDVSMELQEFVERHSVTIFELPEKDVTPILDIWKNHSNYSYISTRPFMFMKFYVFSTYFKQWDVIFYIDSGTSIYGPLDRMKKSCHPSGILYGHSDAYPYFEWKLRGQFAKELSPASLEKNYNLDVDYFQGTMFIYDTAIIEDDTVDKLFDLAFMYPSSTRMDQGILNLYFNCDKNIWRQIPVRDEYGFLYDYLRRGNYSYLMLKTDSRR
jgi:lipopolysaccharide biosynthesis glycosyltransferase